MIAGRTISETERKELDKIYCEGGLRQMASPHVHYHDAGCPHAGCAHRLEWIDFQFKL